MFYLRGFDCSPMAADEVSYMTVSAWRIVVRHFNVVASIGNQQSAEENTRRLEEYKVNEINKTEYLFDCV